MNSIGVSKSNAKHIRGVFTPAGPCRRPEKRRSPVDWRWALAGRSRSHQKDRDGCVWVAQPSCLLCHWPTRSRHWSGLNVRPLRSWAYPSLHCMTEAHPSFASSGASSGPCFVMLSFLESRIEERANGWEEDQLVLPHRTSGSKLSFEVRHQGKRPTSGRLKMVCCV